MEELTVGKRFYQAQIAYLESNDVDTLISKNYNEDAILLGFNFTVEGREALTKYLRDYLDRIGGFKLKSTDRFAECRDAIFFEATVTTGVGEVRVYDAFVLRNGKVAYHFTGEKG